LKAISTWRWQISASYPTTLRWSGATGHNRSSIVTDPTIVVADEPTRDLDTKSAEEILNVYRVRRIAPGAEVALLTWRIADDPRINLEAGTKREYYCEQSVIGRQLRVLGLFVARILALAAGIAGASRAVHRSVLGYVQ
jgi:hypothetical protein